ncbi:MAG: choice-of-anchor J domain-containing protein [Chitinophagaceae bacterium]|nr:choice-of-anchor J domain-containing protein [Chitinophagaceae bacterium]
MRKLYSFVLLLLVLLCQCIFVSAQVTLTTSPYTENFNGIGSGLPAGFGIYTGATTSALGSPATLTTAATAWSNSTGAFKNFASATAGSSASSAQQSSATDRALGVRQTGSFGDPGAAFVFQVTNTLGRSDFKLSFDLQSLDAASPRTTTWKVQYGIGASPSVFTDAGSITGTLTAGGSSFTNNSISVNFGTALDEQNDIVTIRIVTLSATTGSGSRASSAIDNFSLSWTDVNPNAPKLTLTDASANTITAINFPLTAMNSSSVQSYILDGSNLAGNAEISVTGTGFSVSDDNINFNTSLSIPPSSGTVNKTIYVKFAPSTASAYNGTIAHTSSGAAEKDLSLSGLAFDPSNISFDFNTCSNGGAPGSGFIQYSVTGAQIWSCTSFGRNNSNGVNINGYANSTANDNEDWLISPKLDLSNYANFPILSFWSRGEFNGPSLTLWASVDYDGSGNPDNFTWTQLNANFPPLNNTWTQSTGIDLTIYKNTPVYIAFKYVSGTDAGAARWTVDDMAITNSTQIFSATPSMLYFGEQSAGTQSAGKSVLVHSVGYGDVTVNAPANYSVSSDNSSFSSSIIIPEASAQSGATIYVRFAPASKQLIIADTVIFTNGTDLNVKAVAVSGSSYPKSETLDAACYNLSFFGSSGSSAIVRTPQQITDQINNIATVFQHLNIDVAGFEEMSSESSLSSMVSQLNSISGQNYSTVVSDRYSYYFQAPDPNYPPQKIGFLYNTATMALSATEPPRAMFRDLYNDILNNNVTLTNYPGGNSSSFWASGRLPYMATFTTNINGVNKKIRVIVIHAKAGADQASYDRRKYDAQVLKDSIDAYYLNDNVIILGDYNDRFVSSITNGQQSSYQAFISDNTHYMPLTYQLDLAGQTSFPGDNGMIDQIMITQPLFPTYLNGSTQIEPANTYISPYNKVVASDHLPVYSRFDIQQVLPVTLVNFSGKAVENSVLLTWTTAAEFNNDRFLVQRSTDGINFITIGIVKGAGTASGLHSYQYTDNNPVSGANYYRLIQEDIDGRPTVSGTIRINFSANEMASLRVYPNPVSRNGQVTLALANAAGVYNVTVFSVTGNVVLKAQGSLESINRSVNDQLGKLNSGIYMLQLSNGMKSYQSKLIKY